MLPDILGFALFLAALVWLVACMVYATLRDNARERLFQSGEVHKRRLGPTLEPFKIRTDEERDEQ